MAVREQLLQADDELLVSVAVSSPLELVGVGATGERDQEVEAGNDLGPLGVCYFGLVLGVGIESLEEVDGATTGGFGGSFRILLLG